MIYDEAFKRLIEHEGENSDDRDDPGNWTGGEQGVGFLRGTRFGISAAAYPDLDIFSLTLEDAKAIYLRDYWLPLKLDTLPPEIRFDMFDTGVNAGLVRARLLLQAAVLERQDGNIGPATLRAIFALPGDLLDKRFNGQRLMWLTNLKRFPKYGKGWVRRIAWNLIND